MRILVAILLALVALGAAGFWALAEFGGNHEVMVAEDVTPVAREEAGPTAEPVAPTPEPEPEPAPSLAQTRVKAKPAPTPAPVAPAPAPAVVAPAPLTPEPTPAPPTAAPAETAAAAPEAAPTPTPTQSAASKFLRPSFEASPPRPVAPAPAPVQEAPAPQSAPVQSGQAAPAPQSAPAPVPERAVTAASAPRPQAAKPAAAITTEPAAAAPATASLADQFKTRKIAYNRPPTTLILDRPIDISLVIDATAAPDAAAALQGFPGTVVERDVELSDIVSAQLTGVGFDINTQTVERQKLSPRTQNRWQWRVTPTETGTRTLILQIYGYESGSLEAEPLDSYRDDIQVEVKQLDQVITFAKKIQPLFGVIAAIAGACSALFAFLKFKNERKKA